MKSTFAIVAAVTVFAFSGAASAGPGEDLIAKEKCSKCHTATTTKKGPSFASMATKYKADAAAAGKLVNMLKAGSADHEKVAGSDADLKAAIAVVLASK